MTDSQNSAGIPKGALIYIDTISEIKHGHDPSGNTDDKGMNDGSPSLFERETPYGIFYHQLYRHWRLRELYFMPWTSIQRIQIVNETLTDKLLMKETVAEYFHEDLLRPVGSPTALVENADKLTEAFRNTWGEDALYEAILCFEEGVIRSRLKKPTEFVPLIQVFKNKANVERLLKAENKIVQKAAALALAKWPATETE